MLSSGQRVGDYEVVGLLGDGGMGAVYEAIQVSLERTVALKVIDQRLSSDEEFRERFRREGQIQARLEHPNIVPVYQAGEAPEGLFLAMRIIRGTTLKEIIADNSLTDDETIALLGPIADALDVAHADDLIHRDVKPQNILVDHDRRPFLADFGLTKSMSSAGLTRAGQFVGTFDYVAPEQVLGEESGPGADIYALAAVLFECLAGVPPFVRSNDAALLYAHVHEDPPDLRQLRPDLGKPAAKVLRIGLAKDPKQRYSSATELMEAVERAFGSQVGRPPARGSQPPPAVERKTDTSPPRPQRQAATSPESVPADQQRQPTAVDAEPTALAPGSVPGPAGASNTRIDEEALVASSVEEPVPEQVPPSPEAGDAKTFARRRRGALAAGASLLALTGILIGLTVAGTFGSGEASGTTVARSAPVSVSPPGEWRQIPGTPIQRGTGAGIKKPAGLSANTGAPVQLAVGISPSAGNRYLLSPELQGLAGRSELRPGTFAVAGNQAFRYRFSKLGNRAGPFLVFAMPTTKGVVTLLCRSAGARSTSANSVEALEQRCGEAAQTLRLNKPVKGEPLSADEGYASALNRVTGSLGKQVKSGAARLRSASNSSSQANAAKDISRSYRLASSRASRLGAPQRARAANRQFAASLRRTSTAYSSLASAASAESAGGYSSAKGSIRRSREAVRRSLNEFRLLGYRVAG